MLISTKASINLFTVATMAIAISACSGGGGGGSSATTATAPTTAPTTASTSSVNLSPSLGLIRNADVRILDLDGAVVDGATGEVGASGTVSISYPAGFSDPVIIEVLGDADAEYFDESTQTFLPFPEGSSLRVVLSSPKAEVGVTPLTEIAAARFVESGGSTAADADAANEAVRLQFLPGITDITIPPVVIGAAGDRLGDSPADIYAAYLATLAELGAGQTSPALAITRQLARDFSDGNIDGAINGTVLADAIADFSGGKFQSAITAAIAAVVAQYSDGSLQVTTLTSATTATGGGNSNANGTTTAATINAAFVGSYTLGYSENASGAPFSDKEEVSVEITAGGNLIINSTTLTSPFNRDLGGGPHLPEIIWLDEATDIEYALSDNSSGSFNEINVGDATNPQGPFALPGFLGQLRVASEPASAVALLGPSAGTYNWTVTQSGSGYDAGDMFSLTIGSDGAVSYLVNSASVEFNSTQTTYTIFDTRTNSSNRPGVSLVNRVGDTEAGAIQQAIITFEGNTPTAVQLAGFGMIAEQTPAPAEVITLVNTLISASPATLRVTQNSSYTDSIVIPSQGNPLCQEVEVDFTDPVDSSSIASIFSINFRYYSRLDWRYNLDAASGTESLGKNGVQASLLSGGDIQMDMGFVTVGSTLVGTNADIATNNVSDIAAACSDYSPLTVSVSNNNGAGTISGSIVYFDDATDAVVANFPSFTSDNWVSGTTTDYTVYVENGTTYAIDGIISGLYQSVYCATSGRFGTGSATNTPATFNCSDTPPAGTYSLSGTTPHLGTVIFDIDGYTTSSFGGSFQFDGLEDGTDYSITSFGCLSAPIEGTINGGNEIEDFTCDVP